MESAKTTKEKKIHFRKIFYPFLAFMYGIIVARGLYSGDIEKIIVTSVIFIAVAVVFCLNKKFVALAMIFLMFVIGNGFYFLGIKSYDVPEYSGKVCIEGRISDDIEKSDYGYYVILDDVEINGEKGRKINLYISNTYSEPIVGQKIIFESEIERVKPFTLKTFNSFSYRNGVRYSAKIREKDIVFLDNIKTKPDETIRLAIKSVIYKHIGEENAGIAMAMLFGDKNDLNDEISDTYKNVGIIHILTVSGLHVGFLIAIFYGLLKRCRANKYLCLALSAMFIVLYAYLCGFTPAVMRAGIMAIVMITAKTFFQQYDSLNSLGLAGFIICLIKPLSPLDVGFLMSFFTVFSVLCLNKMFRKFFSKFLPFKVASLVAVTTSAQLGILPLLAHFGGQVHILSFMVNLIVLPILSFLFPFLFVVSFIATIIPFAGYLSVLVDYGFKFITLVAVFFESSNLAISINENYFALTVLYFVLILGVSEFCMITSIEKLVVFSLTTLLIVVTLGCYYIFPIKSSPSVAYISSGSSYSVVLTNTNGEKMVVGYNYLLSNYKREYYINSLDTFVSLDGRVSGDNMNTISNLGIKNFISYSALSQDVNIVPTECDVKVGNFTLRYKVIDEVVAGVLIKMDNQCIFVASGQNLSYNTIEKEIILKENLSLVFTGNEVDLRDEKGYILMSQSLQNGSDYSYKADGNMKFLFKKNAWIARGLD